MARGYDSREVLPIRDPTFKFTGFGDNMVDYSTNDDGGYQSGTIVLGPPPGAGLGVVDAGLGVVDAGPGVVDAGPGAGDAGVVVRVIYSCEPAQDAQGNFTTLVITNNVTGQQTTVDDVHGILQCPGVDPTLTILRPDANGVLTLWSGPFDALQQIPLAVTIVQLAAAHLRRQ